MSFDGMKEELVCGKIYRNIKIDERVTKDLSHCLYCVVSSRADDNTIQSLTYRIPLNWIYGDVFKQCPACKRIYMQTNWLPRP